jgi:hypothetical protein
LWLPHSPCTMYFTSVASCTVLLYNYLNKKDMRKYDPNNIKVPALLCLIFFIIVVIV